jgi:hypothetical protein
MYPKQRLMLVEKKTAGQWPVWTSAFTSVPTAPASSGRTWSHDPVAKPGSEMALPDCEADALLCTCQPLRPNVVTRADALAVPETAHPATTASTERVLIGTNRDTLTLLQAPSCSVLADRPFVNGLINI